MEHYLPYIFIGNIFLTLVDATIGYHAAPSLARLAAGDEETAAQAASGVRILLSAVVALYTFFNCLAYFRRGAGFLLFVTGVLVVDMVAQLVLSGRMRK